jgi:hypothetical protein
MIFSRLVNKTAYRTWNRILFRLHKITNAPRYPVQTIFVHVPKTAGSSINEYFSSFIGSRRSAKYVPVDKFRGDAYDAEVSDEGIRKARGAQFVTGHIDWQTVESIRQPHAFIFSILRDPAERLLSNYHYMHRIDENNLPGKDVLKKLKSLTFEEFCTSDDPEVLYSTNNYMVRQLSGRINGTAGLEAPFGELLEQALKNLATMDYVGFQQTLDRDFHDLVQKTGFPLLRLPKENITKKLSTKSGALYNAAANKQDLLRLAAPRLKWDMALYEQALVLAPEINRKPFMRG